jgi:hypothetical protein
MKEGKEEEFRKSGIERVFARIEPVYGAESLKAMQEE